MPRRPTRATTVVTIASAAAALWLVVAVRAEAATTEGATPDGETPAAVCARASLVVLAPLQPVLAVNNGYLLYTLECPEVAKAQGLQLTVWTVGSEEPLIHLDDATAYMNVPLTFLGLDAGTSPL